MTVRALLIGALALVALPSSGAGFTARVDHAVLPDGTRIAHYVRGQGPLLLMCMGSGSTMGEWDPALLALLARRHRLIMWDYRGIGLSDGDLRGLTMSRMADDAAALLTALGVDRADVLGWSLGGFVAQRMAARHPSRVRRVVLAGTNAGGPTVVLGPEWAQGIDSDPDRSDAAALSVLFPSGPAGTIAGRAFLRRLERAVDAGEVPDDVRVTDRVVDAQLVAEGRWMASNANLRALGRLRAPVLVTGGGHDVLTPPANDAVLSRRIPDARRVTFPRGGHAFLFQFHARFARVVNRFLAPRGR